MATQLPFASKVILQSDKSQEVVELSASFGDGYAQVAGNGIMPVRDIWNITIKPLNLADTAAMESFLSFVGTWGIILWTPSWETVNKSFKLRTATRNQLTPTTFSFSLTLAEV